MDHRLTMSVRNLALAGVVALALVTACLLGGVGSGRGGLATAQAAPAGTATASRTLTMTGTGQATAVPDQLSFSLAVETTRADLDVALATSSRVMDRVLGSLRQYGVNRGDVRTTGLSMTPVYDYHPYDPPTIRGYHVTQRVSVLVKELAEGGRAVSTAVAVGGNAVRVGSIALGVGDTDSVLAKARDAAVASATAKAEQYAAATGQDLGDVVTLREVRATAPRPAYVTGRVLRGALDEAAAVPVPIRTGHDDLRVTVQVVWEFR